MRRRTRRPATPPEATRCSSALDARPAWLGFLPDPLFHPRSPVTFLAIAWACSLLPSVLLSGLLSVAAPNAERPEFHAGAVTVFLLMVGFSPLVETLLMSAGLVLLLRFVSPGVAIAVSALAWGVGHSLAAPVWGLVIWWPFLIFSIVFVTWRHRGYWAGTGMAALAHASHNLLPALWLLLKS